MKQITHEEVRKHLSMWSRQARPLVREYITQQQAKEERAKKEHELLELYRKAHPRVSVFNPFYEQIKALEGELK